MQSVLYVFFSDKIVNVKEEVSKLTAERDAARSQNASYEEQIQKLGIQLQNLHFVLEQFQKGITRYIRYYIVISYSVGWSSYKFVLWFFHRKRNRN